MSSFGDRLRTTFANYGQLCVGIDPSVEQLVSWGLQDSAEGARIFGKAILEACEGSVGIVKPQVAFFEQYGPTGLGVLSDLLLDASEKGLLVIADAKRGDIGSTMDGYTRAWLSAEASFTVDALTLSPYLGVESLSGVIDSALQNQKGVFILAATSNPEAMPVQSAIGAGETVAGMIAAFASGRNSTPLGSIGLVIGATVDMKSMDIDLSRLSSTPILMPGFGAQGARLDSLKLLAKEVHANVVCSVSRSISAGGRAELSERIRAAKQELSGSGEK